MVFEKACNERTRGELAAAIISFAKAASIARSEHAVHWQSKALVYEGACQIRIFKYPAAMQTLDLANTLALQNGDKEIAAGAVANLATLYAELGDFALAERRLQDAIADLKNIDRPDLQAQAYLSVSYQQIRLGHVASGLRSSEEAIAISRQSKMPALEAQAWDYRGSALLEAGDVNGAEVAFDKSNQVYDTIGKKDSNMVLLMHLAELRWRLHKLPGALENIERVLASNDQTLRATPRFYALTLRAKILRDMGHSDEAIRAYREARAEANMWRRSALPGDTTNIQTVQELDDVYAGFARFAAGQSLLHSDKHLAQEAFETLVQNRASTLWEQLAAEMGRDRRLPSQYVEKLGELQEVEARITLADDASARQRAETLENDISELENKIALRNRALFGLREVTTKSSLTAIESALGPDHALVSISLGPDDSFLWAVTAEGLNLYRLPDSQQIGQHIRRLLDQIERDQPIEQGSRTLGNDLFSQLDPTILRKRDWLIVGDGILLDRIPFALLSFYSSGRPHSILDEHTVRLLPSELFAASVSRDSSVVRFFGVSDPIYNSADSRITRPVGNQVLDGNRGSRMLGRLPMSRGEVEQASKSARLSQIELLSGANATLDNVVDALNRRPNIVHFATHIVAPPGHPEEAAVALTLNQKHIPELLTRETIASLQLPSSLVVLSGCSSGQGRTVPAAGLIGLSRAWLLAGASAVVVSNWPTSDDSGRFFSIFYSFFSQLSSGSIAQRAALALSRTQLVMARGGGYGSSPNMWGAYTLVARE